MCKSEHSTLLIVLNCFMLLCLLCDNIENLGACVIARGRICPELVGVCDDGHLACKGAILSAVWTDSPMPTVDCLGEEFLNYVKDGMTITVDEDGTVTVED